MLHTPRTAAVFLLLMTLPTFSASATAQQKPQTAPWVGSDLNGHPCRGAGQGSGPYDYTDPSHRGEHLQIVEKFHLGNFELSLDISKGHDYLLGGLDYTLRAFPNHHRALYSLINYDKRYGRGHTGNYNWPPPECYLQRAAVFRPKDGNVYMLHGLYLHNKARLDEAKEKYVAAEKLLPASGEVHYNLGLLYLDSGDYENALIQAKKAYSLGYPLQGLRQKLEQANKWR